MMGAISWVSLAMLATAESAGMDGRRRAVAERDRREKARAERKRQKRHRK